RARLEPGVASAARGCIGVRARQDVRLAIVTDSARVAAGRSASVSPNQFGPLRRRLPNTLTSIRALYNRTPEVSHVERSVIHAAPAVGRFGRAMRAAVRPRLRRRGLPGLGH